MKLKLCIVFSSALFTFTSCGISHKDYNTTLEANKHLQLVCDSLKSILSANENEIQNLKDSLVVYSYPADQRFNAILENIKAEKFEDAKEEIKSLVTIFPNSKEAADCNKQLEIIEKKIAQKIAEEERIKALGFKAIKQQITFSVDYNKITLSSISIGSQFTFDSYDDRWFYREADRGNRYVTARMSVTSTNKYPQLPEFAIYSIKGDEMNYEGRFDMRYARWDDYGSYLGNEADFNNDFTKTSTVRFKLGAEVNTEITKSAFAIVAKNENVLTEEYDRFKNPPKSWTGYTNFAYNLKVKDFEKDYTLIKLYNLK